MDKKQELSKLFMNRINQNKSIKYKDFKKEDSSLLYKIERVFGNITNCAEYCGISKETLISDYGMSNRIYNRMLNDDEILNRLLYLKSIGKLNTNNMRTQFDDLRLEYSLKKKFGSVKNALEFYGLERDSKLISTESLINQIKKLESEGYDLSYANMIENKSKIIHTFTNKLNMTWYKCLDSIGVKYEVRHVPKYDKYIIKNKLEEIMKLEGTISYSIIRSKYSGILSYVRSNYDSIFKFYEDFGYNPFDFMDFNTQKFKGYLFERVFKELLDVLGIKYEYNKFIDNNKLRPDFILEDGTILDCKLSGWTSTISDTIEKYKNHTHKIIIVYLRGKEEYFNVNSKELKIVNVEHYLSKLNKEQKEYFIGKMEYILNSDNFIETVTTERTASKEEITV